MSKARRLNKHRLHNSADALGIMFRMATSNGGALPGIALTRSSAVADEIRRLILSGELPPGTRLRQVELAARFGVSTTPVREAFRALVKEGLVHHDAQRGVVVFTPTVDDVQENYEIRLALEPLATERAARRISNAELDRLEDIIKRMRKTRRLMAYQALNRELHYTIYAAAGRRRMLEIIESLRDAFDAYVELDATVDADPVYDLGMQEQHEAIYEALRARAPARARKLMHTHLEANRRHFAGAVELRAPGRQALPATESKPSGPPRANRKRRASGQP